MQASLAPRTGKIIKNGKTYFEQGGNLLQNGILNFVFWLRQSSGITLES